MATIEEDDQRSEPYEALTHITRMILAREPQRTEDVLRQLNSLYHYHYTLGERQAIQDTIAQQDRGIAERYPENGLRHDPFDLEAIALLVIKNDYDDAQKTIELLRALAGRDDEAQEIVENLVARYESDESIPHIGHVVAEFRAGMNRARTNEDLPTQTVEPLELEPAFIDTRPTQGQERFDEYGLPEDPVPNVWQLRRRLNATDLATFDCINQEHEYRLTLAKEGIVKERKKASEQDAQDGMRFLNADLNRYEETQTPAHPSLPRLDVEVADADAFAALAIAGEAASEASSETATGTAAAPAPPDPQAQAEANPPRTAPLSALLETIDLRIQITLLVASAMLQPPRESLHDPQNRRMCLERVQRHTHNTFALAVRHFGATHELALRCRFYIALFHVRDGALRTAMAAFEEVAEAGLGGREGEWAGQWVQTLQRVEETGRVRESSEEEGERLGSVLLGLDDTEDFDEPVSPESPAEMSPVADDAQ